MMANDSPGQFRRALGPEFEPYKRNPQSALRIRISFPAQCVGERDATCDGWPFAIYATGVFVKRKPSGSTQRWYKQRPGDNSEHWAWLRSTYPPICRQHAAPGE